MNGTDTFWAWGVPAGGATTIMSFYSTNLQTWINHTAYTIENISAPGAIAGIWNNAVARLDTPEGTPPAYVMALESTTTWQQPGTWLMATFATLNSSNLSAGWNHLDAHKYSYTSQEYSACPTIRHFGGWYYVASLFSPGCSDNAVYQQILVRSRDLKTWYTPLLPEKACGPLNASLDRFGNGTKYNPIVAPLFEEERDKQVGKPAWNYNTTLTEAQKQNVAVATDISNSDMDWCDDGQGGVYISYGWSNQWSSSNMFLGAAMVRNASQREWLE